MNPRDHDAMTDWTASYTQAIAHLERYSDLVDAVVAIAGHRRAALEQGSPQIRLEAIAHRVRSKVPHLASRNAIQQRGCSGLLAHMHEAIFEDMGLGGDGEIALHPDASDLDIVLETGRGLPIACSLIYCSIAERLGIEAFGIDAPGHFLVGVRDGDTMMIVDPFGEGRLVDLQEFVNLVQTFDDTIDPEKALQPAPALAWLDRWLRNLVVACDRSGESHLLSTWTSLMDETVRVLGSR